MGDEAFRELSKVDPNGDKLLDDVSDCTFISFLIKETCKIQFSFHVEFFLEANYPVFKAHLVPWVEFSSLTLRVCSHYLLWQRTLVFSVSSPS